MSVPFLDLKAQYAAIKGEIETAITEVMAAQQFRGGPITDTFEAELAQFCGVKHALGCGSGTDALWLSMKALNVQPGDEVITSPFTFFATAGAIVNVEAVPVFADIDPRSFCINPKAIEALITPKTKGIIPVHLYGQCADMKAIQKIADAHGLWVLEDAAQAIGAKFNDRHAGSMGNAAALSFYPTKNLGAMGEGGAVLTNDDALAERVKLLRCHGMVAPYKHLEVGINSHLHTLQAAILRVKLRYLAGWNSSRRDNAAHYDAAFAAIDAIQEPYPTPGNFHVYHQYVIRVGGCGTSAPAGQSMTSGCGTGAPAGQLRDKLAERLKAADIGYGIFYPIPLHRQPCFAPYCAQSHCPEADKAAQEVLALPIYPELTKEQLEEVVRVVVESSKIVLN